MIYCLNTTKTQERERAPSVRSIFFHGADTCLRVRHKVEMLSHLVKAIVF